MFRKTTSAFSFPHFHTAHISPFCGRCGNTTGSQCRLQTPLAALRQNRTLHTAHISPFYGRCGNTTGSQYRLQTPLAALRQKPPLHNAHFSPFCGRCGNTAAAPRRQHHGGIATATRRNMEVHDRISGRNFSSGKDFPQQFFSRFSYLCCIIITK